MMIRAREYYCIHRRPEGGATWGSCPPPWNLKMMTSYAVAVENTLKFSLAQSALASTTLKLSLQRQKNRANFRLSLLCAEKVLFY